MNRNTPPPKMSRAQAKLFWKLLTPQQKSDFNKMLKKLNNKELQLTDVRVDDNEHIQRIILEDKDKPSTRAEPFYKHFKVD